jgi:hypothetical protein
MKALRILRLPIALAAALLTFASAQGIDQPLPTASYILAPIEGSGIGGNLQVAGRAAGGSRLTLTVNGIREGTALTAALYPGDCGPDRERVTLELEPIGSFPEDPFASITDVPDPVEGFADGDLFVMVFAVETGDVPVACGEVGLDANVAAPTLVGELSPLVSQSYALFAVDGSGVNGVVQVTGRSGGGSRLIVTLSGIRAGDRYAAILHEGDCGPDRPRMLELQTVGNIAQDPFSSVTEAAAAAAAFFDSDLFLYIRNGSDDGPLVACGEVGLGANR